MNRGSREKKSGAKRIRSVLVKRGLTCWFSKMKASRNGYKTYLIKMIFEKKKQIKGKKKTKKGNGRFYVI